VLGAMLFSVSAAGVLAVFMRVRRMPVGRMCVMGSLLVISCSVMLGSLGVMTRGVGVMFSGFMMMIGGFVRHLVVSFLEEPVDATGCVNLALRA
jgi:hypothetical protein